MALKRTSSQAEPQQAEATTGDHLAQELQGAEASGRRLAARGLANHPDYWQVLLERLPCETDHSVREALFCSLESLGGQAVVDGLIELLRSDEAHLRNGAIEVLQAQPEFTGQRIDQLLQDTDSDVRIFAIDILQTLVHPRAPQWLRQIFQHEEHPNVLGAAVDRATEIGDPSMREDLLNLRTRVADTPYLVFAIDLALKRIGEQADEG